MRRVTNTGTRTSRSDNPDGELADNPPAAQPRVPAGTRVTRQPATRAPVPARGRQGVGTGANIGTRRALASRPRPTSAALLFRTISTWQLTAPHGERRIRAVAGDAIIAAYTNRSSELRLDLGPLTTLPDCLYQLTALQELSVVDNYLKKLPELPGDLKILEVGGNDLQRLPHLPASLHTLKADFNNISELPQVMPPNLTLLSVHHNCLRTLPPLPDSLQRIDISANQLQLLPDALPQQLVVLQARFNVIRSLPVLPEHLQHLDVACNLLQMLPAYLPATLTDLNLYRNTVTQLPELPLGLVSLNCGGNRLTRLAPSLPHTLRDLNAEDNQITVLPLIPSETRIFLIRGNRMVGVPEGAYTRIDMLRAWQRSQSLIPTRPATPVGNRPGTSRAQPEDRWELSFTPSSAEEVRGAMVFNEFLERLTGTPALPAPAEYDNPLTRDAFVARVDSLLDAIKQSPPLRVLCMAIAMTASETCGDRVALALTQMEIARIGDDAREGRFSEPELLTVGAGMFRLATLDAHVDAEIARRNAAGEATDDVEIRLAYHANLATRLKLPGVARAMLYERCADVAPAAIDLAEAAVRAHQRRGAFIDFLATWQPWREAMQRRNPEMFATFAKANDFLQESLAVLPKTLTDQAQKMIFKQFDIDALTTQFSRAETLALMQENEDDPRFDPDA